MNSLPVPRWLGEWPTTYPCLRGAWTVRNGDRWGALVPETGEVTVVDPAADAALPGLEPALSIGRLVSYRVGRRAVVRAQGSFIKVVRPKRVARVVRNHDIVSGLTSCAIPTVVGYEADGRIRIAVVEGESLHQRLIDGLPGPRTEDTERVSKGDFGSVADVIAALHGPAPSSELAVRTVGNDWIDMVGRFEPAAMGRLREILDRIPRAPTGRTNLVHGDLHDKNVFVGPKRAALIDLDGIAAGPAEADVGNLTAHLMLRALQVGGSEALGWAHIRNFLEAYGRLRRFDAEAVTIVQRHTWLRLSGLYQFRRKSRHLAPALGRLASVPCQSEAVSAPR